MHAWAMLCVFPANWLHLNQMYRSLVIGLLLLAPGLNSFGQVEPSRTGANHQIPRQIRCYPNPATTAVFFELKVRNTQEPAQLRIYNFLGKKVVELPRLNTNMRVDLNNFNRGIYIYQLTDAHGRVMESGKFHVEKP
jgi:hypothetical protein